MWMNEESFTMDKCLERANREVEHWLRRAHDLGYVKGKKETIEELGNSGKGTANLIKAKEEHRKKHGFELIGWCSECGKAIEGRWVGLANFCPWCGRPWLWIKEVEDGGSNGTEVL